MPENDDSIPDMVDVMDPAVNILSVLGLTVVTALFVAGVSVAKQWYIFSMQRIAPNRI